MNGYLLDVNPFDQPGVENYKQKMFTLLGRDSQQLAAQPHNAARRWDEAM